MIPVTLTLTFLSHPSKNKMWPPQRWTMPNFTPLCAILWSWWPRVESERKKKGEKRIHYKFSMLQTLSLQHNYICLFVWLMMVWVKDLWFNKAYKMCFCDVLLGRNTNTLLDRCFVDKMGVHLYLYLQTINIKWFVVDMSENMQSIWEWHPRVRQLGHVYYLH